MSEDPTSTSHQKPPMRGKRFLLWLLAGLALASLVIVWWTNRSEPPRVPVNAPPSAEVSPETKAGGSAPPSQPAATDVQVVKPARQDIAYTVNLPANVAPLYQTTLYAKVSGYLKWIGPDKGDVVKKGQVLAILDAPEVQEQYQQAVADYKIKKLTYERLNSVWQETPEVIAKQDVDLAEAGYEGAKHMLEQRTALYDYTKVRAPYAGIITARFADPGALIQIATASATGAIPLFTIMDIKTVRVYTNIPQDDAPLVKPGITQAILTVSEHPGRKFKGTVTRTTLALDPATRSMLVEIDLPNPKHELQPGTYGEASLVLRQSLNALSIPPGAIVVNGKAKAVFVVEQGRAKLVPIQTGITDGRSVEVLKGLTGVEDLVVVGKGKLIDGMAVNASPYNLPEGTPGKQKFEPRSSGMATVPAPTPSPPAKSEKSETRPEQTR